jgi:hypothetical protein
MKPYAMEYRQTGNWVALLPFGFGWIIGASANAYYKRRLFDPQLAPFVVFFAAATIFWIISN